MLDAFVPCVMIYWSVVEIFLFCEFGERLTKRFDEIDDEIFDWDWYAFPIEIQKMLPIIMIGTQKQVRLEGFANIQCTRQTFKNV